MLSAGAAIANQNQGQVEHGYSATLLVENPVSGGGVKAVDEGEVPPHLSPPLKNGRDVLL